MVTNKNLGLASEDEAYDGKSFVAAKAEQRVKELEGEHRQLADSIDFQLSAQCRHEIEATLKPASEVKP